MPSDYVKKLADKKGISVEKAEGYWDKAKTRAKEEGHDGEYDYITGIFKRMMGESLTFSEMQSLGESLMTTDFLSSGMKQFILKNFKNQRLKAAIAQYVKFRKQRMPEADAKHKAAGMFGIESDKVFSDIIHDLQQRGLVEGKRADLFLALLEEGEPTNVSDNVDKTDKPLFKKKKTCEKDKKDGTMKTESWKEFQSRLLEATGMKMDATSKRKASAAISKYASKNYFSTPADPVSAADDALRAVGYRLVQEDGTDFSAIFTGREGRSTIRIAPVGSPDSPKSMVTNTMLAVQWYKMDKSNKYEVNMYLS